MERGAPTFDRWCCIAAGKYNIKNNVNSDISIVTMRKVAIVFFELGVIKTFMQNFQSQGTS